jgi:glyoxylase-like metal-dependent hydrolase (beta-lactamase superfamily II)
MPESKHFELQQLTSGVWASIHKPGGWAIGNAGIIDLGDQTLIFDTHMTPAAAEDLRQAAETLTGRPASVVILSHYHNDHIWGAQLFRPEATIYATHENKTLIQTRGQEEYDYFKAAAPQRVAELTKQQAEAKESDPAMEMALSYYAAIQESLPTLEVQTPNVTFGERLVLHGGNRRVEVLSYGGGHTPNDAFLYLPDDGIIFLSDLLFVDNVPFLADGDPWEKLRILDKIAVLEAHTLVPGHGPAGPPAAIEKMKDYIITVDRAVSTAAVSGKSLETMMATPLPAQYSSWGLGMFHAPNLQFFYEHYAATGK